MLNHITPNSRALCLNWYLNDDKVLRSRWTVENATLGTSHKPIGLCGTCSFPDDVGGPHLPGVPYQPFLGIDFGRR